MSYSNTTNVYTKKQIAMIAQGLTNSLNTLAGTVSGLPTQSYVNGQIAADNVNSNLTGTTNIVNLAVNGTTTRISKASVG